MKILYHSDSPTVATGFGNLSKDLLKEMVSLDKDLEITVLGINERGGYKDPKEFPYKIYPAIYDDYNDVFGFKRLVNILTGGDPEIHEVFDAVIFNYDFWLFDYIKIDGMTLFQFLKQFKAKVKNPPKLILYTPVDNELITPEWLEILKFFDKVIVPSMYGKGIISRADKALGNKVKVIYYGFDPKSFYPLSDKEKLEVKKSMGAEGKFVVGYVARNQWRKDMYRVIKTFAMFHEKYKSSFLYIHCNPVDMSHDGGNLLDLCRNQGLQAGVDVAFPFGLDQNVGLSKQMMNAIYNAMDVQLSGTTGEGFGMPFLEAMLAGTINVAPNNTTIPELFGDERGLIYQNKGTVCFGQFDNMRIRTLGDETMALRELEYVYKNKSKIANKKKIAREWAMQWTARRMAEELLKEIK